MTGEAFRIIIERTQGLTQSGLARRWGVSRMTLWRETQKEEVRPLYRDALLRVLEESDSESPVTLSASLDG
jgi:hypothetical protein